MDRRQIQDLMCVVGMVGLFVSLGQAQPDPREMSGIPLPVGSLESGTITVRVVRGQLSNNILGQTVNLYQGDTILLTSLTNDSGRAHFSGLSPGTQVYVETTVGEERVKSRRFSVPREGGIRLMLVASDEEESSSEVITAEPGTVTLGGESRFLIELGEENVDVYYLFDVVNSSTVPVVLRTPLVFEIPSGAQAATILPDSTPLASVDGSRIRVTGPFGPGRTPVKAGYALPYSGDSIEISQPLPIDLEEVLIIAEKAGEMEIVSSQIIRRGEMEPTDDRTYLLAVGSGIPAGGALTFSLVGLPYHGTLPLVIALIISLWIVGWGIWATAKADSVGSDKRQELEVQRERLFRELVRVELQQRSGRIGPTRYEKRRSDLLVLLEQIYQRLSEELAPAILGFHETAKRKLSV